MRGYLELLVPLYNQARPSSALHLATSSVALAACCHYPDKHYLRQDAAETYGQALRKLNEELSDTKNGKIDENILAILLFSLYEVCFSLTSSKTRPARGKSRVQF